jgi:hypothetical protein
MVAYTLRSCIPGRRWAGVLVPCAAAVLFGLLSRNLNDDPADAFPHVASTALFGLILPVTCLVIGDAVLGAELRSGTFTFTFMSPVPTWQIALARWMGGSLAAGTSVGAAFALAAVVAGAGHDVGAMVLAGGAGALAYVAVFLAIGCLTRRAAAWSLAFVFLVERLLGSALSGVAQISPGWQARAAYVGLIDAPHDLVREGMPHGTAALVRLGLITAIALVATTLRLSRVTLSGSSD